MKKIKKQNKSPDTPMLRIPSEYMPEIEKIEHFLNTTTIKAKKSLVYVAVELFRQDPAQFKQLRDKRLVS